MASPTFIDGFEQFDGDVSTLLPMAGYGGGGSIPTAAGRRPGSVALLLRESSLSRVFAPTGGEMTVGVAARFSDRGGAFLSVDSVGLSVGVDGLLSVNDVQGQVIPAADKYYYYEMRLDWTAGEVEIFVNGKSDIVAPLNGDMPDEVTVTLGGAVGPSGAPLAFSVDDFYIADSAPLGPIEVATQMANVDASPQAWATSKDAEDPEEGEEPETVSHAEIVGALPPDPLDSYIQSGTAGAEDRFTSSTVLNRNDVIKGVTAIVLVRVTRRTNQELLINSGDQQVGTGELAQSFQYYYLPVPFDEEAMAETVADDYLAVTVGDPVEGEA